MKKTLLTLGLAIALAIPTGLAVAAAADEVIEDVPVTVVEADETDDVRDLARLRDCEFYDGEAELMQNRNRLQDPDHECGLCDGDAVAVQERAREQARLEYDAGTGFKAGPADGSSGMGHGEGALDGTGPIQEGPEDGMGNQFGPVGR